MTNATNATIFDSEFFSPEFREWLLTSDLEDIYSAISDHYKEENGIRPRWMHNLTREEYAAYFIRESEAAIAQKEMEEWDADVRNHPLTVEEPEPYPYEEYDAMG